MRKRVLSITAAFVLCIFTAFFVACTDPGVTEENLTETEYPLRNLSGEFTVEDTNLKTYYKEESSVPYVGVEDFLSALDGVFDSSGLRMAVSEESGEYVLYHEDEQFGTFVANWKEDTVTISGIDFFLDLMRTMNETDYNAHTQLLTEWDTLVQTATFDLGKYGFDVIMHDGQLLLPFCIANLMFCGTNLYNVYFNGESYYGLLQSEIGSMSAEDWAKIRTCGWNGTEASAEMRQTTVNFLNFALDYFYGLKDYKGIGSFGDDVITGELLTALLSGDEATHNQAYVDLFQKTLSEMHTTLVSPSFFAEADSQFDFSGDNAGPAMTAYMSLFNELSTSLINSVGQVVELPDGSAGVSIPAVRFEGNTAIIILSSFSVGENDLIYNEDGTVSDTAHQYDTYYFMKYAMKKIEEYGNANGTEIKNVVLDLTTNSGGSLAAMVSALGFLTDEPIPYSYGNLITKSDSVEYYLVDTDDDGDYKDADAYDMYDWYVLTSPLTFSAANFFASIVKDMGIATVVGEQSGGGTCSVFTLVLPDGTTVNISGSRVVLQSLAYENGVIVGGDLVESGITPDIALDRKYFYDNEALIAAIENANQAQSFPIS